MHRAAYLFDQIVQPENLRLAFFKAARGRRGQQVVQQFAASLPQRIASMSVAVREGTFPVGRFHQFFIRDPKERIITAPCFEERVLHHGIMNLCEPVFDRWLIDDTFACRVGKGREGAIRRAQCFTRRHGWFLKLDVRKFFDSVPHVKLAEFLERRFKDRRLLALLNQIIHAYRGELGIGLPIGSLTSQHFANFYLGWLDRFVKEQLRPGGYVRYMDDMLLWHDDRQNLKEIERLFRHFVAEKLSLELKPAEVRRVTTGIPYLGCRIWPTHVELNRRSKRRWGIRVRILQRAERLGLISERDLQVRLTSLTAFAQSAGVKSWRFRHTTLCSRRVDDP